MNTFLAQVYGTGQVKESQMDQNTLLQAFAKQAADENLDLNGMSDAEVESLFGVYVDALAKQADEKKDEKKEDEEKKAAAAAEFLQMKEAQEKLAEADFIGRQIAHACIDELRKIAAASDADGEAKEAGNISDAVSAGKTTAKQVGKALKDKATTGFKAVKDRAETEVGKANIPERLRNLRREKGLQTFGDKAHDKADAAMDWAKKHKTELGVGAGASTAALAAGYAAGRKKQSSAFDEAAAVYGLKLAHAYGIDPEVVGERLDALFTLGQEIPMAEGKVASAQNLEHGIHIRALELLEQVGVPVDWNSLSDGSDWHVEVS